MSLVHAGWDSEVAARPHGHRTTVVVHLDLAARIAAPHLGPLLSDDDRRYLTCDATCVVPGCGAIRGLHAHHLTLGRRRPHRTRQSGAGLSVSPPAPSPGRYHPDRPCGAPRGHRCRRPPAHQRVVGPAADHTAT
jgi:hypothetical protein